MEIYPNLSQFLTGQEVKIIFETDGQHIADVEVSIWRMEKKIKIIKLDTLSDKENISLGCFSDSFAGFGVEAAFSCNGCDYRLYTAFDVVDSSTRLLRYGFLSDFDEIDQEETAIHWLAKCHINLLQFYDWSFRHHQLVSTEESYTDMMGKRISSSSIKKKISCAKELGMLPMAYGAVYASGKDFYEKHSDWGLYTSDLKPYVFINVFYIMNIARNCLWRKHLISQYMSAMKEMGFSGIHMDTYGFPKTAYGKDKDVFSLIHLDREFPSLINETRESLENESLKPCLIFNNVGNWPASMTASSKQDAVYIEVWPPYTDYYHIAQIINEARKSCSDKKTVILAAYLKPFREGARAGALPAARLLMAAIVSHGATHLLLGEKQAVLTQGYYSDYTKLFSYEEQVIRRYYDFMVRYSELLYDTVLSDVSMTHCGGDNFEYKCLSHRISLSAEAGFIWLSLRQRDDLKLLSLINLCGLDNSRWNEGKSEPIAQKNIELELYMETQPVGVFCASPDDFGEAMPLPFTYEIKENGRFIRFSLPKLNYWSIIFVRQKEI